MKIEVFVSFSGRRFLNGRPHIVDALKNGEIHPENPLHHPATGARSTVRAIEAMRAGALDVAPLQSYF